MRPLFCFLAMAVSWNVAAEMSAVKDCTVEKKDELRKIIVTGANPRLCEYDLTMATKNYRALRLVYSATDLPSPFTATVFYLPKGEKKFSEACRLPLYNLIADGQPHEVRLTLPEKWYRHQEVTALRLDPVANNPRGVFVIHKLEWLKNPDAAECRWDQTNDFGQWGEPMRGTATRQNGNIRFVIQGKNSRLYNNLVKVDTRHTSTLVIRYRAQGLPDKVSGNLFFQHEGDKNFVEQKRAGLRNMIADGEWHTIKVALPDSWRAASTVIALRLDLADQAESGTIEIESIQFIAGSVHAETLNPVPVWPDVKSQLPVAGKISLPDAYWQARMIFSPEDKGQKTLPYAIRKKFTVPADLSRTLLQITADDCFAVWINGKPVLDKLSEHIWSEPVARDVTEYLRPGKENLICVKYINFSGPGGVLFQLGMMTADRKLSTICSDAETAVALCPDTDAWLSMDFQDQSWDKVAVGGTPPMPPWIKTLPFRDMSRTISAEVLSAKMPERAVAGQPFPCAIELKTTAPIPAQRLTVKLFTLPNQIALPEKYIDLPAYPAGTNRLVFDLPIPRYFSDCKLRYSITSDALDLDQSLQGVFSYKSTPIPGKNIPFEVRKTANGARLFADGKPTYMLCGNVHVTDSRYAGKLEQVPVNFRTCHLKMNAPHKVWIRSLNGNYDFSVIDRCVETRLEIDPDVHIIFSMELGLPHKYAADFKRDIVRREDGSTFTGSVLSVQPGSALNKAVIQNALAALVKYCEKAPYANRIAGFLLADGETMEWQYFGSSRAFLSKSLVDYSPGAQEHYQQATGQTMPTTAERLNAAAGLFYNPATQQNLIRCNEYFSEVMAANIIDYCRTMKNAMTVPKLCGVYYGYHLEYGNCNWRRQIAGHNRLREVLDSKVVDFITSPPSYSARNLGNSGADMKPFASISQAGILPITDDDTRTHLIHYNGYFHTLTPEQTTNIVRRNLGQYLCRQECVWMLPLCEGREFDDPQTLRDLAIFKKAAEYQVANNVQRHCEIAVVVDERIYDLMAPDSRTDRHAVFQMYSADGKVIKEVRRMNRLFGELVANQRERLAKSGAPVDYLLASDVAKNIGKYKLWIFLDTFQYDEAFLEAVRRLQASQTTLVWCYAPGYIHDRTMNTDNMKRLTGMEFTRLPSAGSLEMELTRPNAPSVLMGYPEEVNPRFAVSDKAAVIRGQYYDDTTAAAIAQKRVGSSNTWFFGGNFILPDVWRMLAREAGVHVYSDSDDTLFANDAFVAFHAERPGTKVIRLPKKATAVWDLFSRTKIAENVSEFTFDSQLHESRIFFLGDLPAAMK